MSGLREVSSFSSSSFSTSEKPSTFESAAAQLNNVGGGFNESQFSSHLARFVGRGGGIFGIERLKSCRVTPRSGAVVVVVAAAVAAAAAGFNFDKRADDE